MVVKSLYYKIVPYDVHRTCVVVVLFLRVVADVAGVVVVFAVE